MLYSLLFGAFFSLSSFVFARIQNEGRINKINRKKAHRETHSQTQFSVSHSNSTYVIFFLFSPPFLSHLLHTHTCRWEIKSATNYLFSHNVCCVCDLQYFFTIFFFRCFCFILMITNLLKRFFFLPHTNTHLIQVPKNENDPLEQRYKCLHTFHHDHLVCPGDMLSFRNRY